MLLVWLRPTQKNESGSDGWVGPTRETWMCGQVGVSYGWGGWQPQVGGWEALSYYAPTHTRYRQQNPVSTRCIYNDYFLYYQSEMAICITQQPDSHPPTRKSHSILIWRQRSDGQPWVGGWANCPTQVVGFFLKSIRTRRFSSYCHDLCVFYQ